MNSQPLTVFAFESAAVRTVMIDGEPWFVASDIAGILGYRNAPDMVRMLDDDEADTHNVRIRSANGVEQQREFTIINESGLYACILKSRRQEAKVFRKWVTAEVLPAIRRTGGYGSPELGAPAPPFTLSSNPAHAADQLVAADRTYRALLRSGRTAGVPLGRLMRQANDITRARTGIDLLDTLGVTPAPDAPQEADPHGVAAFAVALRSGDLQVPYTACKSADLYRAYVVWCNQSGIDPIIERCFARCWLTAAPDCHKTTTRVRDPSGRVPPHNRREVIPRHIRRQCQDGDFAALLFRENERFSAALRAWQGQRRAA